MKVIHAFGRVYDLFNGEGWEKWTRFSIYVPKNGPPTFTYVDGYPLTREMFNSLKSFQPKVHSQNV